MPKLQETLAGRIVFLEMFPVTLFERYSKAKKHGIIKLLEDFSLSKICSSPLKRLNLLENTLLGTYPEPMLKHERIYSADWYDGGLSVHLLGISDIIDVERLNRGGEIDLIIELPGRLIPVR